jgi:putative copper resistance protein D
LIDPLVAVRAIEFAAAILIAGAVVFSVLVAAPVWHRSDALWTPWLAPYRKQASRIVWISLALVVVLGAARLVLVAADIAGESWIDVIVDGMAWSVLNETQFGIVSQLRLVLSAVLAGLLLLSRRSQGGTTDSCRTLIALAGASLLVLLAWTGHASGASGAGANVHLVSDVLHILAAGTWIGGLVPLALLMRQVARTPESARIAACGQVLRRYSNLGVVSVATLLASGFINMWFLTDHLRGLIGTDYGRLLQIKIGLFLAMLCLAAINRLRLLRRIPYDDEPSSEHGGIQTLRQLQRNTALEIALGLAVIYIVGVLGVTPPAGHTH